MTFDSTFIEELKYRNPIEDVIAEYVKLTKRGSNMVGLCPFHSEKTGSFTVFMASRTFYCFGCGAGGDVITFIMKAENLDYRSAVEFLAKRSGLTVPDGEEKRYGDGITKERLWEMNKEAARFFRDCLYKNDEAKSYVFEKRRLSQQIVNRFGLGFAPNEFGMLTKHMHSLGYSDAELVAGFLCKISEKTGHTYDIFRNRVMFPIIDIYGNIIAFGGRVMDNSTPKYLNSSDTRIFNKRRNLFALNIAKNNCSDGFILCEGYMDVISLHEAGFQNAVASLGTSLTSDHARIMRKYTENVIMCYDSDEAGQKAANRAFAILGEAGLKARVLKLDGAKDPDEYIKKYGGERFRQVISGSSTEFDYKFAVILKNNDINQSDGRIKAAVKASTLIAGVSSAVERSIYTAKAAEVLSISSDALKADVERIIRRKRMQEKKSETKNLIHDIEDVGERRRITNTADMRLIRAEQAIIGMLILHPELYTELIRSGETLGSGDFITDFEKRVAEKMFVSLEAGESFDYSGAFADDADGITAGRITKMVIEREKLGKNDKDVLLDCVKVLKNEKSTASQSIEDIINAKREKLNK